VGILADIGPQVDFETLVDCRHSRRSLDVIRQASSLPVFVL